MCAMQGCPSCHRTLNTSQILHPRPTRSRMHLPHPLGRRRLDLLPTTPITRTPLLIHGGHLTTPSAPRKHQASQPCPRIPMLPTTPADQAKVCGRKAMQCTCQYCPQQHELRVSNVNTLEYRPKLHGMETGDSKSTVHIMMLG